jgi:hypothetical protein
MNCQDLLKHLNEYVDGTVEPGICEEFKQHMAGCNPCQVVVDNIRQTVTLCQSGAPCDVPREFRERLHKALRQQWKEQFPTRGEELWAMPVKCR